MRSSPTSTTLGSALCFSLRASSSNRPRARTILSQLDQFSISRTINRLHHSRRRRNSIMVGTLSNNSKLLHLSLGKTSSKRGLCSRLSKLNQCSGRLSSSKITGCKPLDPSSARQLGYSKQVASIQCKRPQPSQCKTWFLVLLDSQLQFFSKLLHLPTTMRQRRCSNSKNLCLDRHSKHSIKLCLYLASSSHRQQDCKLLINSLYSPPSQSYRLSKLSSSCSPTHSQRIRMGSLSS